MMHEPEGAVQESMFPFPHGPLRDVTGPDDLEAAVRSIGPDADVSGIARAARAFLTRVEHILDYPYDSITGDGWVEHRAAGEDGTQNWHLEVRYDAQGQYEQEPISDLYRAVADVSFAPGAIDAEVELTFEDVYENGETHRRVTIPLSEARAPSLPALIGIERFFYAAQVNIIEGATETCPRLDRTLKADYFGYARS